MAESNSTPALHPSHKRTTQVRTRPAASSLKPKIEFPIEDQGWIALQERTIQLTGKPIEDLSYRERQEMRLDLSDTEQVSLKEYLRARRLESTNAFDCIVSSRNWTEKLCGQTLGDLIDFQDYLRAVALTMNKLPDTTQLGEIERDLLNFLNGFPGAEVKLGNGETWSRRTRVLRNIGRVPPTDEGIEFMENFYERVRDLYEGSNPPHIDTPSSPTVDKGIPEWEQLRRRKAAEIEAAHQSGKHVFSVEVIHVQANKHRYYYATARTEGKAYREAIKKFDAKYPNARRRKFPIRVRVSEVDGHFTRDYPEMPVSWNSKLVKSIRWGSLGRRTYA